MTLIHQVRRARALASAVRNRKVILSWRGSALDYFAEGPPSPQKALDIFRGEWSSRLPPPLEGTSAGSTGLFEDPRIEWAIAELGGVEGKTALELGPLEGGHTYMLHRAGAAEIVSVEANSHAYLKCLIVKELFDLRRARFLRGDLVEYLRTSDRTFDVCLASGVLYHLRNPAELIALAADRARQLFLWTHYYDEDVPSRKRTLRTGRTSASPAEHRGFQHVVYRQEYGASRRWAGFCGGSSPYSHWLSRRDMLACLEHFGWSDVKLGFDEPRHPNGPALALTAVQR